MSIFKKKEVKSNSQIVYTSDNELLLKLRECKEELKKLDYKSTKPLRHALNDFCLNKGYRTIPTRMELFKRFFTFVDNDYQYACSEHSSEELDFVIEILQKYRNEIFEKEGAIKREMELKQEINELKTKLGIGD